MEQNSVSILGHITALIEATKSLFDAKLEVLAERLGGLQKFTAATAAAAKEALHHKDIAQDAYNKTHNELQRELTTQAESFVNRQEHKREMDESRERIRKIEIILGESAEKLSGIRAALSGLQAEHAGMMQRVAKVETDIAAIGGLKVWMWKAGIGMALAFAAAQWLTNTLAK